MIERQQRDMQHQREERDVIRSVCMVVAGCREQESG